MKLIITDQMKVKENQKEKEKGITVAKEKKTSNLVIQTHLDNSFDNRWAEIKIEGKNIASRSNHASAVFGSVLYIHGGYDVDRGVLSDFHQIDLSQTCQQYVWKKLNNTCNGKQIKLKGHSACIWKENLVLFGGELHTSQSSNRIYLYDIVTKGWKCIDPPQGKIPKIDSHCAVVSQKEAKMYVYGGYICDQADYLLDILAFSFQTLQWQVVHKGDPKNKEEPEGRSNFAMVQFQGALWIFGGTNGIKTLNDQWKFDLTTKKWVRVQSKDTPQPRRGHSMIKFDNFLFMFGGIQDITKEKNDVYIYQPVKSCWAKIQSTTNSVYDCSPTLKKQKKAVHENVISPVRISPEKGSEKGQNAMKKILIENKQKKFLQRKKELLKQFAQKPEGEKSKKRQLSPTTQSMVKTLQTIGNQQSNRKQLKQQIIYDQSHRFIIGKKPCARDGQSVNIYNGKMYIFGGDRHLMAFNDLYLFDLEKGVKSLELYKN